MCPQRQSALHLCLLIRVFHHLVEPMLSAPTGMERVRAPALLDSKEIHIAVVAGSVRPTLTALRRWLAYGLSVQTLAQAHVELAPTARSSITYRHVPARQNTLGTLSPPVDPHHRHVSFVFFNPGEENYFILRRLI